MSGPGGGGKAGPRRIERGVHPLELLGGQKARRVMAARLADAVCHVLGGIGVTINVTLQEAAGDPKTGSVPFSTYTYCSWGAPFDAQAKEDQAQIAVAHHRQSIAGVAKQLEVLERQLAEAKQAEAEGSDEAPVG